MEPSLIVAITGGVLFIVVLLAYILYVVFE